MKLPVEVEFPEGSSCEGCVFLRRYDLGAKSQCLYTGEMVTTAYEWERTTDHKTMKSARCPEVLAFQSALPKEVKGELTP